jgi:hypothetical protein
MNIEELQIKSNTEEAAKRMKLKNIAEDVFNKHKDTLRESIEIQIKKAIQSSERTVTIYSYDIIENYLNNVDYEEKHTICYEFVKLAINNFCKDNVIYSTPKVSTKFLLSLDNKIYFWDKLIYLFNNW